MRVKGTDRKALKRMNEASGRMAAYSSVYPEAIERAVHLIKTAADGLAKAGIELVLRTAETPDAAIARLHTAYGLTAAEARLALHVAEGGALPAYAVAHALSRHTVRNQLQAIFQKTGVRRQAELVALLAE